MYMYMYIYIYIYIIPQRVRARGVAAHGLLAAELHGRADQGRPRRQRAHLRSRGEPLRCRPPRRGHRGHQPLPDEVVRDPVADHQRGDRQGSRQRGLGGRGEELRVLGRVAGGDAALLADPQHPAAPDALLRQRPLGLQRCAGGRVDLVYDV